MDRTGRVEGVSKAVILGVCIFTLVVWGATYSIPFLDRAWRWGSPKAESVIRLLSPKAAWLVDKILTGWFASILLAASATALAFTRPGVRRIFQAHGSKLKKAISYAVGGAIVFFMAVSIIAAVPELVGGSNTYTMVSDSMLPKIQAGDMVIIRKVAPQTIKVGEVAAYTKGRDPAPIIHRLIGKEIGPMGEDIYVFKGDASNLPEKVAPEQVVGKKVFYTIPKMGYATAWIRTKWGFLLMVMVPTAVVVISEISKMLQLKPKLDLTSLMLAIMTVAFLNVVLSQKAAGAPGNPGNGYFTWGDGRSISIRAGPNFYIFDTGGENAARVYNNAQDNRSLVWIRNTGMTPVEIQGIALSHPAFPPTWIAEMWASPEHSQASEGEPRNLTIGPGETRWIWMRIRYDLATPGHYDDPAVVLTVDGRTVIVYFNKILVNP